MRIGGLDTSSSFCGLGVADDGVLKHIEVWQPSDKKASQEQKLYEWYLFYEAWHRVWKPDIVAFEEVQSARNAITVRILARFEAAAIIVGKANGSLVLPCNVKTCRKVVLGRGDIDKEEAFEQLRKTYPQFAWARKTVGGMDQSDAIVIALAAPTVLERR